MNPARLLLLPYWTARLASGAKSFADNPLIGSHTLNRWGLHERRVRLAHRLAAGRRGRLAHLVSDNDRAAFDRDGFVLVRDFLPPELFWPLREKLLTRPLPAREMRQGDAVTRRSPLDAAVVRELPEARALLRNARWRGLLRYIGSFDAEPLIYLQSIHTDPNGGAPDPQTRLHADTFHPTVKAWLFLTDVAEDEGPFVFVPGSHRLTRERLEFERTRSLAASSLDRLSARGSLRVGEDELGRLRLPPPRAFAVPANTLIVADTFGFHARGPSARGNARAEIWAYGRRNPFLPWTGLDPLSARSLAERRVGWHWRRADFLHRLGLGSQPWRPAGHKTALDPA